MLNTRRCATTVLPRNSNSLRENKSPHAGIQRTRAHSLLGCLCLALSHLEGVKHDSNHRANHRENDCPLDELFLQRFLSKRLMINLIEHVSFPLSANNRVGSHRDVRITSRHKTLGECSSLILPLISRKTKK